MVTMATLLMASGVALALNVIQCKGGWDACYGTSKSDQMKGTAKVDVLAGRAANDFLYGYGGEDHLFGDDGNDELAGGGGPDELYGKDGSDGLAGGSGPDSLYGENGNDRLVGGDGRDYLLGARGDDRIKGEKDADEYRFGSGWGRDTVVDARPSDFARSGGNMLYVHLGVQDDLVIRLNSDSGPRPEVQAGTNTVNWDGNAIDQLGILSAGDDDIIGNGVANDITSVSGASQVRGGGGDDIIYVDDGDSNDTVYCGTDELRPDEKDTVYYDAGDTVAADCEDKIERDGGGGGY